MYSDKQSKQLDDSMGTYVDKHWGLRAVEIVDPPSVGNEPELGDFVHEVLQSCLGYTVQLRFE